MNSAAPRRSYCVYAPPDGTAVHGDAVFDHCAGRQEGVRPVVTAKDPSNEHAEPPAADDHSTDLSATAAVDAAGPIKDPAFNVASELLSLTVEHPTNGVCVITVDGELDMVTVPLLEACLCEQLCTNPRHLIVDLQPVCFLASHGLNCLLQAREEARTTTTQLHLAGLVTHAVARPLQVSQLLEVFNTYPTLTQALTAIID
jgi:stage II sporulation protein AA (anti-sigma F factor antagonist)